MTHEWRDPAHAQQFEALRRTFQNGLTNRLHAIENASDSQSQHDALHRLAGAAGAFGYEALGLLARSAMQRCKGDPQELAAVLEEIKKVIQNLTGKP